MIDRGMNASKDALIEKQGQLEPPTYGLDGLISKGAFTP